MSSRTEASAPAFGLLVAPAAIPAGQTTIVVRDLEVQADIGVNMEEIGRRQPLVIHAELRLRVADADELAATFDYRELVRHAEALATERIALIETYARRLAGRCLEHPQVVRAEIAVDKPWALPTGLAGVRVVIESA